jgi:outer membrane receptor for ferrienterochelin and colicin
MKISHLPLTFTTALLLLAFIASAQDSTKGRLPDSISNMAVKQLGAVVVTARSRLIVPRIDGYLYNAKDHTPIAGEKAADILRRLPGVMVSPEGHPSINGSSRIKVFIDGKPSETFALTVADALNLIPTENIATIEVINHPSAKYEAEGVAGVINIITRQPTQNAISGTLNTTVANRSMNLSGNLLLKRDKWLIGIDAGLNRLDINVAASTHRYGQGSLAGNVVHQERFSVVHRNNEYAGATFTYSADSLTSYYAGYRIARYHDYFRHRYDNIIQSGSSTDSFTRIADNLPRRWLHTINAGYNKRSKDKKAEFSLLAAGFYRPSNDRYTLVQEKDQVETYQEINSNTSLIREATLQVDYSRELKDKTKIELGGRYNHRDLATNNHFDVYDYNVALFSKDFIRSGKFGFNSSISALYLTYSFNIKSYKLRTGMRYEHTSMKLSANDTNLAIPVYGNLLPNLLISKVFKRHTLSASYAKRIQRPYMVYLSPVINYMDSLNIEYGNPDLKPIIIHNFLVTHTFTKNRITLTSSAFINRSVDNIEYVRTLKPNGTTESTWFNISSNTVYGTTFNFSWQSTRFSFRLNNTLQSVFFNTDGTFPQKRALIFSNGGYFSYKFNKGYTLTSYTSFNTKSISLQGHATGTQWYNIILSKGFMDGRLNMAVRIDNIFTRYQYVTESTSAATFYQQMRTRSIYRFFKFNISYRIGRKEIKVPQQRTIANEM